MLLNWGPLWDVLGPFGLSRNRTGFWLILAAILIWLVSVIRIVFSRRMARVEAVASAPVRTASQENVSLVPETRFADVGGLDEEKKLIRELVESQVRPERYRKYGVTRNGILLHGPRGSGKSFLAEATAGEFGLRFRRVLASELIVTWMGETERNIRAVFADAASQVPVLLFIDELDALGATRQALGAGNDPGGAGRSFNSAATQLMDSITRYREVPQFVIMAATNHLDALDQALTREGRFDLKIRLELSDEATRRRIFESILKSDHGRDLTCGNLRPARRERALPGSARWLTALRASRLRRGERSRPAICAVRSTRLAGRTGHCSGRSTGTTWCSKNTPTETCGPSSGSWRSPGLQSG
jgi:SpoVK/Ycf46/Vps4 family AAA+-type ATPase